MVWPADDLANIRGGGTGWHRLAAPFGQLFRALAKWSTLPTDCAMATCAERGTIWPSGQHYWPNGPRITPAKAPQPAVFVTSIGEAETTTGVGSGTALLRLYGRKARIWRPSQGTFTSARTTSTTPPKRKTSPASESRSRE